MSRLTLSEMAGENLLMMRIALILLALSIVTGLGLHFGGSLFERRHQEQHAQAQQRLDAARQNRARTATEQENIRRYLAPYQALLAARQIGEERRLDWIDALGRSREQRKFFPMEYDIAARRPYTFTGLPSANALTISASRMNIKFSLLHEGDLFTLLNDLHTRKAGLFALDHCEITRNPQEKGKPLQLAQNLVAECSLDWLSVGAPSSPPATSPTGR
ncbi:MAG: hypothetical protein Q8O38_15515 [Sulfurimicrobium sp.]|nr:hypothetical protein [Sulfurimicrobium sp.]